MGHLQSGAVQLAEIKEFASFNAREQRYIRISLEIASDVKSYDGIFDRWSRNLKESEAIFYRYQAYSNLENVRELVPEDFSETKISTLTGPLVDLSNFDLMQGYIECFSAYRFLYERLLGAKVRPWLTGSFCIAAALPNISPRWRKLLLQSISEEVATSPGWTKREPTFIPEWVEKVE